MNTRKLILNTFLVVLVTSVFAVSCSDDNDKKNASPQQKETAAPIDEKEALEQKEKKKQAKLRKKAQKKLKKIGIKKKQYGKKLLEAVDDNDTELLQLLIEAGADVNYADSKGKTPLLLATNRGYVKCMAILLSADADVNKADHEGYTPLGIAVQDYCYQATTSTLAIELLLTAPKINVNRRSDGMPPLMIAAWSGNCECAELLIEAGASVNTTYQGMTPYQAAKINQQYPCASIIEAAGGR